MIASPLVEFLERKLKISRKHTSMVIIIIVLGAIIGGSYLICAKVMTETGKFLEQAPDSIRLKVSTAFLVRLNNLCRVIYILLSCIFSVKDYNTLEKEKKYFLRNYDTNNKFHVII